MLHFQHMHCFSLPLNLRLEVQAVHLDLTLPQCPPGKERSSQWSPKTPWQCSDKRCGRLQSTQLFHELKCRGAFCFTHLSPKCPGGTF